MNKQNGDKMRELKEISEKLGGKTLTTPVFGLSILAEKLLEWSKKVAPGVSFRKETSWGCRLEFIANKEQPMCLLYVDEAKLSNFLNNLGGPLGPLHIETYGITLVGPLEHEGEAQDPENYVVGICMKQDGNRQLYKGPLKKESKEIYNIGGILVGGTLQYLTPTEVTELATTELATEEMEKITEEELIANTITNQVSKLSFNL